MNEYGRQVKKTMDTYMDNPDSIDKEISDIQNALKGVEVRGALAAGVKKSFNKSVEAEATSENAQEQVNNIQSQVNQLVVDGDSSVEAAQARVDSEGHTYDTLKERLDTKETELSSQVENIAIIPKLEENTDITDVINDLMNTIDSGKIKIPNGIYLVDAIKSINFKSNITFEMSENTVLKIIPNSNNRYQALNIDDVENVTVVGGTILGDRNEHLSTEGEQGYGINIINNSHNILVDGTVIKNCWGDGFYIGRNNIEKYPKNVTLRNVVADNNRRNGIAVTTGKDITLDNPKCLNTNGTAPQAGIILEPQNNLNRMEGIRIINPYTESNGGAGIQMWLNYFSDSPNLWDVTITNHIDNSSVRGMDIGSGSNITGAISIINPKWYNNYNQGFRSRDYHITNPRISIFRPIIIDASREGSIYPEKSNFAIYSEYGTPEFEFGNVDIIEPYFQDTDQKGYRNIYCSEVKDVNIINPIRLNKSNQIRFEGKGLISDLYNQNRRLINTTGSESLNNFSVNVHNEGSTNVNTVLSVGASLHVGSPSISVENSDGKTMTINTGTHKLLPLTTNIGASVRANVGGEKIKFKKVGVNTLYVTEMIGDWVIQ